MNAAFLPTIEFKDDRIQKEWESGDVDMKLVWIIHILLQFLAIEFPKIKSIMLTCVFRFDPEQDNIYLNHTDKKIRDKYKKKRWLSVHQFWRGADIRIHKWPIKTINKIVDFLNLITYDPKRLNKKTSKSHNVGTGAHIHIQTYPS